MTFGLYFMLRQTEGASEIISESVDPLEFRRACRRVEKDLRGSYIKRLYDKFPKIQYGDVEEAFEEAMTELKKGKPKSEASTKRAIRKLMEKRLSEINRRKKSVKKSLSCLGSVKSSLKRGESFQDLMKRAEKTLTSQEKRVVDLCSSGKPVRKIAEEIGTSFPTAWRILNAAIDKIRMSHGMRPRHKDMR